MNRWKILSRILALSIVALWAVGCRFDVQGIEEIPDSAGIVDAETDAESLDAVVSLCVEDRTRCGSNPPRIEVCSDGEWVDFQRCDFKCLNEPEPRCGNPVFQNGMQVEWLNTNNGEFVPENPSLVEIDTDFQTFTVNGFPIEVSSVIVEQGSDNPTPPGIMVATFDRIIIHAEVEVKIRGSRVLALGSKEDVFISGRIEAAAERHVPGPGGWAPGSGPGFGQTGSGSPPTGNGGGGGAGHLAAGGRGGSSGLGGSGGSGGQSYGALGLSTLAGGSGGGSGASADPLLGTGGAGGGAIMLFSLGEIAVLENGYINAGGGGGYRGGSGKAGGGGGSGGAIVLEAPWVRVLGVIAANGGGGGGGDNDGDGENGQPGNQPASGGNNAGQGGAGVQHSGNNGTSSYTVLVPGGGGGACGRIRIRTVFEPVLEESGRKGVISPDPDTIPVFAEMKLD